MKSSILHVFFSTARRRTGTDALRFKRDGVWQVIPWETYADRVRRFARALIGLGLAPGERVIIISGNRWEWLVADLGIMAAGGVPAPVYPTCTADQVAYIIDHSEARIAIVEDRNQLDKIRARQEELPRLEHLILLTPAAEEGSTLSFTDLLDAGNEAAEAALEERLAGLTPEGLATLIYTSGTTGLPKAAMLSHRNLVFTAESCIEAFAAQAAEQLISYLPLSHIAEQMMSVYIPVTLGGTVSLVENVEQLGDTLREVRPTILFGVPRVFEKIQARIASAGQQASLGKRAMLALAKGIGIRAALRSQAKKSTPLGYGLASRLVFDKLRARLGLDRCRFAICGAAPLSPSSREFFMGIGIPLFETYGLSEVTGPVVLSTPEAWRLGSVGIAIPHTQIRIAPDGEVLVQGEHVFMGYLKDEGATREALGEDGWLKTGDIGELDADGFLTITDRKKDLIVTAGGKNVAPLALEALLKAIPAVSQAVVVGDRRKYISALLTLDPQASGGGPTESELQAAIDAINRGLAHFETIKKFRVLPAELSVESGELTPTLKVKRNVVAERYRAEIDAMYASS